ncbi:MAG: hypothetical protein K0R52_1141 [Alphaproteobacteria bacterium]|jgi:hypothetical protein|nr:hypothetical protein [Alphaproteobacteria bacterium]
MVNSKAKYNLFVAFCFFDIFEEGRASPQIIKPKIPFLLPITIKGLRWFLSYGQSENLTNPMGIAYKTPNDNAFFNKGNL